MPDIRDIMMKPSPHRNKEWTPHSIHGYSLAKGPHIPESITHKRVANKLWRK